MYITKIDNNSILKRNLSQRACTVDDINMLVAFQNYVVDYIGNKVIWGMYDYDYLLKTINNDGYIELYYDKDVFVGFLMLIANDLEEFNKHCINNIKFEEVAIYGGVMLSPRYWGNGLQKQMTERLEKLALEKDYKYIVATVSPENSYSYNNLIDTGYKVVGEKDMSKGFRYILVKKLN